MTASSVSYAKQKFEPAFRVVKQRKILWPNTRWALVIKKHFNGVLEFYRVKATIWRHAVILEDLADFAILRSLAQRHAAMAMAIGSISASC